MVCLRGQVCLVDEERVPRCLCNSTCPSTLSPVCASDGTTYRYVLPRLTHLALQNCVVLQRLVVEGSFNEITFRVLMDTSAADRCVSFHLVM